MKKALSLLAVAVLLIAASCNDQHGNPKRAARADGASIDSCTSTLGSSQGITLPVANKMLNSYLNSINAASNDTDLQCLIYNADSLRNYLNDTSKGKIKQVKFMFAHTTTYAAGPKANQNCGYRSGALTLIIVGYDNAGNYIYNAQGKVLDNMSPCPPSCPQGAAGCDTFAVQ